MKQAPALSCLFRAFRDPAELGRMSEKEINFVLRTAYRHFLLARLGHVVAEKGDFDALPSLVQRRLRSAMSVAAFNTTQHGYEISSIRDALRELDGPLIFLKGAAYHLLGLDFQTGRISTDVDILVPKDQIRKAETLLLKAGWKGDEVSEYDDHYYREWAHEIPPMRHQSRRIYVDLHHNIIQLTSRIKANSEALIHSARCLEGDDYVLSPEDMVLHAALHLFYDDMHRRVRDIVDLHELISHFSAENDGFIETLTARAKELGMERALYYAFRYTTLLMGTYLPERVGEGKGRAPWIWRKLMDWSVPRTLILPPEEEIGVRDIIARHLLLFRSHWLRMPPHLLVYHFFSKLFRRKKAPHS